MTVQPQDQTPFNGVERRKGWGMRWNPEVNPGHLMQVVTVIGAAIVLISTWSSDKTKTELTLDRIETQMVENQKVVTDKIDGVRTDMNIKITDVKTDQARNYGELTGSQKETAALVTQMQRTLDQTLPRFEDRFTNIMGMVQTVQAQVNELMKWKTEADGKINGFGQFQTRIESASPSSKRGG